ncbi:MAG: hypothetical protein MUD03_06975 [Pirellula sp.]|nr:hypothetical protein [Pirellula sp.]
MFFRTACVVAILLSCVLEISLLQKACLHLLAPANAIENLAGEPSELNSDSESDAEEQRDAWLYKHHTHATQAFVYSVSMRSSRLESEVSPPFSSRDPPR